MIEYRWLADVEIAGAIYRVSDVDVDVESIDGTTLRYSAGLLDMRFSLALEGMPSGSVSIGASATSSGWPLVLARSGAPYGGRVRVYRWEVGTDIEAARVWLDGIIVGAIHGGREAPLELAVEAAQVVATLIPPQDAVADTRTFPTRANYSPDPAIVGASYPLVIGSPGLGDQLWGLAGLDAHSTPAYLVEHSGSALYYYESRLMIGWVPDGTTLVAQTVEILESTGASGGMPGALSRQTFTVEYADDLLGRRYAYVKPTGGGGTSTIVYFYPASQYWVRWNDGGGVYDETRSSSLRKAGEVIRYLLRLGGVPVDEGRMASARVELDRYLLDFAIVQPIDDVEQFIRSKLAKPLGLVRRQSARGVWYEHVPVTPAPELAVAHLVVESPTSDGWAYEVELESVRAAMIPARRISAVAWSPWEQVRNEIPVRYRWSYTGRTTAQITVVGDDTEGGGGVLESATLPLPTTIASRSRYGRRVAEPIDLAITYDAATAQRIATDEAHRSAQPRRSMTLAIAAADLGAIEPGAILWVSDSESEIRAVLVLVTSVVAGLDEAEVAVELYDGLQYGERV